MKGETFKKVKEIVTKWDSRADAAAAAGEDLGDACYVYALRDVAELAGNKTEEAIYGFCRDWLEQYGLVTPEKLLAWAGGADSGASFATAWHTTQPGFALLSPGCKFGLLRCDNRATGQAFVVLFTDETREAADKLVADVKQGIDPRSGAWINDSYIFNEGRGATWQG